MANANPSRPGQVNTSGDPTALFLKVFSGLVVTAFKEKNVFLARSQVRSITSGKSAQFPTIGKGSAAYHTPGAEITGTTQPSNERIIVIDDLLVASRFIAEIDEAMTHFSVRQAYADDIGRALAKAMDVNLAQVGYLCARASATVTGGFGGTKIVASGSDTNADTLIAAAFDAAQAFDEKDVPEDERYFFVKPDQYYNLVNSSSKLIHFDYNQDGTNGSVASGRVAKVAGMEIVKTNNLPNGSNVTTGVTSYQGDFTNSVALALHASAIGTVKLLDLKTEMAYDIRRQGTLLVGKYACGHGIIRPEGAVEITKA